MEGESMGEEAQDLYIDFGQLTDAERASVASVLGSLGKDKLGEDVYAVLEAMSESDEPDTVEDDPAPDQEVEEVMADEIVEEVVDEIEEVDETPEIEVTEDASDDEELVEEANDEPTEDFAAVIAELRQENEAFAERLATAETAAQTAEENFAEEQRLRRLSEFTDKGSSFSFGWEVESFAADAMAVADADPELWERWEARLRAVDEQVRQSGVFEQYSSAGGDQEDRPAFERQVEKIREERYSEKSYADGFAEAFKDAETEFPELGRAYAQED